jgi:trehalose 6-phosphate phosphatase
MEPECRMETARRRLESAGPVWLMLDYDGTLAEFAPTPDDIAPDPQITALLTELAQKPDLRVAIVSGRRLEDIRRLIPVPGVWLGGTYGVEILAPDGELIRLLDFEAIRPPVEGLRRRWTALLFGLDGFHLEDKGWSVAIHANRADTATAQAVLAEARRMAEGALDSTTFQVLAERRFLEVCPIDADKGRAVETLLSRASWPSALVVYIGDDEKDERAFRKVKACGGVSIRVAASSSQGSADCALATPTAVRRWLRDRFLSR